MKEKANKLLWPIISIISALVFTLLVWWIYFKVPSKSQYEIVSYLPLANCFFNGVTSVLLVWGITEIKKGNRENHKRIMISAGIVSAIFLFSYLTYHHFQGDTKFMGQGVVRYIYFFILISHVLLSMIQVPLILGTFYLAFTSQFSKHKRVAKWTFPIWLYVSITGVLIYLFLRFFSH